MTVFSCAEYINVCRMYLGIQYVARYPDTSLQKNYYNFPSLFARVLHFGAHAVSFYLYVCRMYLGIQYVAQCSDT